MTSSLDLLILALIDQGVVTPYALARAGISLGAALPSLKRLSEDGLVKKGKPGARGRTAYELTGPGRQALSGWRDVWQQYLDEPPNDVESVFRVAALAWSNGRRQDAVRLLEAAIERRAAARPAPLHAIEPDVGASVAETYRWMGRIHAASSGEAEQRALTQVARRLRRAMK